LDKKQAAAADPNEPGNRGGSGAASLRDHLDHDARRSTEPRPALGVDRSQHTILVVDDSEAAKYAVARGLRAAGYRTLEGSAGAECLELAPKADAVVLDVHLPDINGLEVCRLLRANDATASLPVVHVTAIYQDEEHEAQSLAAGANAYLGAPVAPTELAALLDTLVDGSRSGTS
jgi:CheY-like chemotaxis protein